MFWTLRRSLTSNDKLHRERRSCPPHIPNSFGARHGAPKSHIYHNPNPCFRNKNKKRHSLGAAFPLPIGHQLRGRRGIGSATHALWTFVLRLGVRPNIKRASPQATSLEIRTTKRLRFQQPFARFRTVTSYKAERGTRPAHVPRVPVQPVMEPAKASNTSHLKPPWLTYRRRSAFVLRASWPSSIKLSTARRDPSHIPTRKANGLAQ